MSPHFVWMTHCSGGSWGEARGARSPPPIFKPNRGPKGAKQNFLRPPPSPLPPSLSKGLDRPLHCQGIDSNPGLIAMRLVERAQFSLFTDAPPPLPPLEQINFFRGGEVCTQASSVMTIYVWINGWSHSKNKFDERKQDWLVQKWKQFGIAWKLNNET